MPSHSAYAKQIINAQHLMHAMQTLIDGFLLPFFYTLHAAFVMTAPP